MTKVLVTGANGMLGTLVADALESRGYQIIRHTREIVDLINRAQTEEFIFGSKPDVIIHCAAVVGGIQANIDGGARFFLDNYLIDHNVLTAALNSEVTNLFYIGSSCMYPANQLQPLKVQDLLSGKLEPTNEDYAFAKLTGMRLTKSVAELKGFSWRTLIASNLYGPGDHFDSQRSHLLASIIYKAFQASQESLDHITMWGDGAPRREFTYAPDLAEWISKKVNSLAELPLVMNVGCGQDLTVLEYYELVLKAMNLNLKIVKDLSKPSGNSRKLMDSSQASKFGWNPPTDIYEGIKKTISWYEATNKC